MNGLRFKQVYVLTGHRSRTEDLYITPSTQQGGRPYYDEAPQDAHDRSSPEAPSIERGNKLLCFQPSTCNHNAFDYHVRQSTASVTAQLHGMFFLAESARTGTGELVSSPPELTCYRRNLFQITGSVTLPRALQYVITESGERVSIVSQELTVSATESVEGSAVKIISVPWKTPANGQPPAPEDKVEREPSAIPLEHAANSDVDAEYSVYPIAWKRLQFRVATANNGRRRELQQHFTIRLSVVAHLANGSKVNLIDALSGNIVVRGRSPRNFSARKDVPLSGSGASMRKSASSMTSMTPTIRRSSTVDNYHRLPKIDQTNDVYGTVSPTSSIGKASSSGHFEWQQVQPNTAPVSPYLQSSVDSYASSTASSNPLKRKSMEPSPSSGNLTVPQAGMYSRNSAPPTDSRPRKMARNDVGNIQTSGPMYSPQAPTASLPSSTFSYSIPSLSNYATSLPKSDAVQDYYPVHMDPWGPENLYRPHVLHPTTAVGGAGSRVYYGEGLA